MTEPRFGYYLTTAPDPKGRGLMAVISDGTPQLGHDPVTILSVKVVPDVEAARVWFEQAKASRPWEQRQ
jgi:hypothetical protein